MLETTSTDRSINDVTDQRMQTPKRRGINQSPASRTSTQPSRQSRIIPKYLQVFKPYRGNPRDPLDICVDTFLSSPAFEAMCVQAIQLATILPSQPPPTHFVSFNTTPMHHWYQALLIEFVDCFMRRLRARNSFPLTTVTTENEGGCLIQMMDDAEAFNTEANAHINSILRSFNTNFADRPVGSTSLLSVDPDQPRSIIAAQALREATSYADYAPKADWKVGEPLASEYRKRLRMFEAGLMRLLSEREDKNWILNLPQHLNRGIAAYKEFYIGHLREEILAVQRRKKHSRSGDDVFA